MRGSWMLMLYLCGSVFLPERVCALIAQWDGDRMVEEADAVLVGRVIDVRSEWNGERTGVYTEITVAVFRDIGGECSDGEMTFRIPGGDVPEGVLWVEDAPGCTVGENILAFLRRDPQGCYVPLGGVQGVVPLGLGNPEEVCERALNIIDSMRETDGIPEENLSRTEPQVSAKPMAQPILHGVHPERLSVGTGHILRIGGKGFGSPAILNRVEFTGRWGPFSFPFYYGLRSKEGLFPLWSDDLLELMPRGNGLSSGPIRVVVERRPGAPIVSNAGQLEVTFSCLGRRWSDASYPIRCYVNTEGIPLWPGDTREDMMAAIRRAFKTWDDVGTWYNYAPTRMVDMDIGDVVQRMDGVYNNAKDGRNVICWKDFTMDPMLPDEAGGIVLVWDRDKDGDIDDADILFNTHLLGKTLYWSTRDRPPQGPDPKGPKDIQDVTTHEIGHFLGLGDLYGEADRHKTMFGSSKRRELFRRDLAEADKRGLMWLYGAPRTLSRLTTSLPAASVDSIPPAPVTHLLARDTPGDRGESITLTWDPSPDDRVLSAFSFQGILCPLLGMERYNIYRRTEEDTAGFQFIGRTGPGETAFVDTTASTGVRYVYTVRAADRTNESSGPDADAVALNNIERFDARGERIRGLWGSDPTVGLDDLLLLVQAFGISSDDPSFEPAFDLDGDGTVGWSDFSIFQANFGRTAVEPPVADAIASHELRIDNNNP